MEKVNKLKELVLSLEDDAIKLDERITNLLEQGLEKHYRKLKVLHKK